MQGNQARRAATSGGRARRALLGAGGVALCCMTLAACGGSDDDGSSTSAGGASNASYDVKIGLLAPLTGPLGAFGPSNEKAARLAVEQVNAALERAGADIGLTLEVVDAEGTPQSAQQAARKLAASGVSCMVGPEASSQAVSVAQSVARREGIPTISPSATSAALTTLDDGGFFNRTSPSDDFQALALANLMEERLGGADGTISIGARNDTYGEGLASSLKAEWEERGGTVNGPVLYDPEQPSYNSEAASIVEGDNDAVVIIDFPETYVKMGAALLRTGKLDTSKLFLNESLGVDEIPQGVPPKSLDGGSGTRAGAPKSGEAAEAFDTLWAEAGGAARQAYDAQTFDAAMLCALAAVAAGSEDSEAIAEQVQPVSGPSGTQYSFVQLDQAVADLLAGDDVDFEGVSGPLDLDEDGDPTAAVYDLWRYADGKLEIERQVEVEAGGGSE